MHCAFKNSPTLEIVLRELRDEVCAAESGLNSSNNVEQTASDRNNILSGDHPKRGKHSAHVSGEGLRENAEYIGSSAGQPDCMT